MANNGKVISAHNIQKTIEWGKDLFDREVMAISEFKGPKLEHQILFDDYEQAELFRILGERLDPRGSRPFHDDTDDEDEDLESELDDLTDDNSYSDEPKYLIIESRVVSGGKKKTVLNWCEDAEEALDTLQTIFKNGEMSTLTELQEKVKIVRYSEIVPLEEIWDEAQGDNEEGDDDK